MRCPDCKGGCWKPECAPRFQEDRLRLWRNQKGTRHANSIGQEMPQTRSEMRAYERAHNIEFVSPKDFTNEQKQAIEYKNHVSSGGPHIPEQPTRLNPKAGELKKRVSNYFDKKHKEGRLAYNEGKLTIK